MRKNKTGLIGGIRSVFSVWRQEYINILSDFGVLLILVIAAAAYPVLYGYAYSTEVLRDAPVALVDLDGTGLSRQLTRMIDATEEMKIKEMPGSLNEAKSDFYKGKVDGVLLIPKGFAANIYKQQQATVSVYCDASYFMNYKQVLQGANYAAGTLAGQIKVQRAMAHGATLIQAKAQTTPLGLVETPLYNRTGGYGTYVMPAVLILILQQTLLIGIGMLGGSQREQNSFHFAILKGSTVNSALTIILGKAGAYISIYLIHAIYLFGVVFRVFHLPVRSSLPEVLVFIFPMMLAVTFLGLTMVSWFRKREQSIMFLIFLSIPILFLSGISWPVESMPAFWRGLAQIIPSTPGIEGFIKLHQMSATFHEVSREWFILWVMAFFYFGTAWISFTGIVKKHRRM